MATDGSHATDGPQETRDFEANNRDVDKDGRTPGNVRIAFSKYTRALSASCRDSGKGTDIPRTVLLMDLVTRPAMQRVAVKRMMEGWMNFSIFRTKS